MIEAQISVLSDIVTQGVMKSSGMELELHLESMMTASMPAAFKIETSEAQLRGPRGEAGGDAFTTDPLAYYLLARD